MIKALRGVKDILPPDVVLWQNIEGAARDIFSEYNYREIRTPIIEEAVLFTRSIGDCTDIVQKEMYVFSDRGGRVIALRPEATASVVRAYAENCSGPESFEKFFYVGPMFRSERPQKGRQRQFYQLGVEAIGSDNPFLDVEIIALASQFLNRLKISQFDIKINSLGCAKDKLAMIENCRKDIKPRLGALCEDCRQRYDKNVLRILDCKNPECAKIAGGLKLKSALCPDCSGHFDAVKKGLDKIKVNYTLEPGIVRGLDYYTKTVFEIVQRSLGAKDAICAGGRYNNLVGDIGCKDAPAIGFAFGMERLVMALDKTVSAGGGLDCFIALTGKGLFENAFEFMKFLRDSGISCDIDYETKSLKSQMKRAQKLSARFVVIFGEEEFNAGKVALRNMDTGEQENVVLGEEVITRVKSKR